MLYTGLGTLNSFSPFLQMLAKSQIYFELPKWKKFKMISIYVKNSTNLINSTQFN